MCRSFARPLSREAGRSMRFLLLLIVALCAAAAAAENGVVTTLTAATFDDAVRSHAEDGLVVLFHAPWCSHCKAVMPEFVEAARSLESAFARIDCDEFPDAASRHGIKNFPSFVYFRGGRQLDVTQRVGRDKAAIVDAVRQLAEIGTPRNREATVVSDVTELQAVFAPGNGVRVIGFFPSSESAAEFRAVVQDFKYPIKFFLAIDDGPLRKAALELGASLLGVELPAHRGPLLLMLKPYDDRLVLRPHTSRQKLRDWLEAEMLPVVVPLTAEFSDMIFNGPLKVHCLLAQSESDASAAEERREFYASALRHRGEVLHIFVAADPKNPELVGILEFLNIKTFPAIVVSEMALATEDAPGGRQTHFNYGGKYLTADSLAAFLEPFAAKEKARKAGLDAKLAEIIADPKMLAMLKDPKMAPMFGMMGFPKEVVELYQESIDEL